MSASTTVSSYSRNDPSKPNQLTASPNTEGNTPAETIYTYTGSDNAEDKGPPEGVQHVTIGDYSDPSTSLTEIKSRAFMDCYSLESVTIPPSSSVLKIGYGAFSGCTSLTSISLPHNLREIGHRAFSYTGLKSILIPPSVERIGREAFKGCYSLLSVIIMPLSLPLPLSSSPTETESNSLYIYPEAFTDCESLVSIKLPQNVKFVRNDGIENEQNGNGNGNDNDNDNYDDMNMPCPFQRCKSLSKLALQKNDESAAFHMIQWLKGRYNNLPLHRVCFHPKVTLYQIESTILRTTKDLVCARDLLGMTALHVLVCNPFATVDMIKLLVSNSVQISPKTETVEGCSKKTPLQLFLEMKNLSDAFHDCYETNGYIPLTTLLNRRIAIEWEDIESIMAIQLSLDESGKADSVSGLYPFMQAAILEHRSLDIVYNLALRSNLELVYNNNNSSKKRKLWNIDN